MGNTTDTAGAVPPPYQLTIMTVSLVAVVVHRFPLDLVDLCSPLAPRAWLLRCKGTVVCHARRDL